MRSLERLTCVIVSGLALWSLAVASPATAGTIRIFMEPRGAVCSIRNGWHYDRQGHHFFGTYRQCVRTGNKVAQKSTQPQKPNEKK
jgi:hypothetical protein